jgi:hypothetical protein
LVLAAHLAGFLAAFLAFGLAAFVGLAAFLALALATEITPLPRGLFGRTEKFL